jgi:hypothetical protein
LLNYAIIGYKNAIHSVTGYTPFEVIKGHINSDNPFEITDNTIISNYVQQHKEKVKTLYENIKENTSTKKEQLINKINTNRDDSKTFIAGHLAKPKFVSSKILSDNDKKLNTQQGTYHKSTIKKPSKYNKDPLLQKNEQ